MIFLPEEVLVYSNVGTGKQKGFAYCRKFRCGYQNIRSKAAEKHRAVSCCAWMYGSVTLHLLSRRCVTAAVIIARKANQAISVSLLSIRTFPLQISRMLMLQRNQEKAFGFSPRLFCPDSNPMRSSCPDLHWNQCASSGLWPGRLTNERFYQHFKFRSR